MSFKRVVNVKFQFMWKKLGGRLRWRQHHASQSP